MIDVFAHDWGFEDVDISYDAMCKIMADDYIKDDDFINLKMVSDGKSARVSLRKRDIFGFQEGVVKV